jgi:ATP-dependent DNA helicase RecG
MTDKLPINLQVLLRQRTNDRCRFASWSGRRRYRNRRIGEFLKEPDLTEGRSTDIPKIIKEMAANGSPAPLFETDEERTSFVIRLPVHLLAQRPDMDGDMDVTAPTMDVIVPTMDVTTDVTTDVATLLNLMQGEMSRKNIQDAMGLKNAEHLRKAYLTPALASGHIEMTLPDKPRSTHQRYRLTAKGMQWLKIWQKKS